jgi:hypothetical protein
LTGARTRSRRSAFSSQAALFWRTAVFRAHFGQGRKIGAHGTPFLVIDGRYTSSIPQVEAL